MRAGGTKGKIFSPGENFWLYNTSIFTHTHTHTHTLWRIYSGALESAADTNNSDLPLEYLQSSLAQESQQPSSTSQNSELQMKEEDDLQLALAMSLNEQENKQKAKKSSSSAASSTARGPSPTPPPQSTAPSAPPPSSSTLYATIMHDPTPSVSKSSTIECYYLYL